MNVYDRDVRSFASRLRTAMVLRYSLMLAVAWGFLWGMIALVLRVAVGAKPLPLLWGLAGIVPVLAGAAMLAKRKAPETKAIRAVLDKGNGFGGLLMAGGETEIGLWRGSLRAPALPGVRWRGRKWWVLLAASMAFVIVALAIPTGLAGLSRANAMNVDRQVDKLVEQIEVLREEEIIEPEKAEELDEKLNQIRDQAIGDDPVKTWEALDHVEQQAGRIAQEAAEKALNQTSAIAKAETLAKALQDGADKLSAEQLAEAMKGLAEMTNKAAADSSLAEKLSDSLSEACKEGSLSQEQLKELLEALGQCKGDAADMIGKLCEAGLLDREAMELCEGLGKCDAEGLADFLKDNGGDNVSELVSLWRSGLPGRGGVSRGRADAEMTWTDGSDPTGAKFKEQVLPPASLASLKKSKLVGVSVGDPTRKGGPADTKSGALGGAARGGGSAHTHTILPRHRRAVKEFFDRGAR